MSTPIDERVDNDRPFKVFDLDPKAEFKNEWYVAVEEIEKTPEEIRAGISTFITKDAAEQWCKFANDVFQKGFWCGWDTLMPMLIEAMRLAEVAYYAVPGVIQRPGYKVVPPQQMKKEFEGLMSMFPEKAKIILLNQGRRDVR